MTTAATAQIPAEVELLAMHGWASDHRRWQVWQRAAAARGWSVDWGERGYGQQRERSPQWQGGQRSRLLLVHSLGLHLVPATVLGQATAVVLLASFGQFLPSGGPGRRLARALDAMARKLEAGEVEALLRDFQAKAAAPAPTSALPPGPLDDGIDPRGRQRLLDDLALLRGSSGLPGAFPLGVPVLVVEAGDDQIVAPETRALLRQALPQAVVWERPGIGHALVDPGLMPAVLDWMAQTSATGGGAHL